MHGVGHYWAGGGAAVPAKTGSRQRVEAVDLLRGLVIMLMVLDHVRDYFHFEAHQFSAVDPATSYPALFAVRWVTHLCAPVFVTLAGASAWLQLQAGKPVAEVRRMLWTRGLWLIALELTLVGFGFNFGPIIFLQVIWAIGVSMIALAALVGLPVRAVAVIGVAIVAGHNLLNGIVPADFGSFTLAWQLIHEGGPIFLASGQPIGLVAYPVLPWIGVMALGFAGGRLFLLNPAKRSRLCVDAGCAMLALFALLRGLNLYGDPDPWVSFADPARTAMSFLNVEKYPPSLDYWLATIGAALLLVPLLERLPAIAARVLLAFGRVPLLAYAAHIYLVHGLMLAALAATGWDVATGFNFLPKIFIDPGALSGWGFGLPVVFAVWALALALLYPVCAWFAALKRRRRDWWLSYL